MKKLLIVLLLLVVAVGVASHLLPTKFDVSRSVVIDAPPEKVHEHVGDLKAWETWAPWREEMEKNKGKTIYGPMTTGIGGSMEWTDDEAGESGGWLRLTKCDPKEGIAYDMAFRHGTEEIPQKAWMTYEPSGKGTKVTWRMDGDFSMKVLGGAVNVGALMNLFSDSMLGGMFEKGLNDLKEETEGKKS